MFVCVFFDLFLIDPKICVQVFVLDFPPRLNVPLDLQDLLRQEFRRVSARFGM